MGMSHQATGNSSTSRWSENSIEATLAVPRQQATAELQYAKVCGVIEIRKERLKLTQELWATEPDQSWPIAKLRKESVYASRAEEQ